MKNSETPTLFRPQPQTLLTTSLTVMDQYRDENSNICVPAVKMSKKIKRSQWKKLVNSKENRARKTSCNSDGSKTTVDSSELTIEPEILQKQLSKIRSDIIKTNKLIIPKASQPLEEWNVSSLKNYAEILQKEFEMKYIVFKFFSS